MDIAFLINIAIKWMEMKCKGRIAKENLLTNKWRVCCPFLTTWMDLGFF
jgi:hypothetical protein